MTALKLFGTDGIRGKAGKYPITAKVAEDLGKALVTLVAKGDDTPKTVVGRDTRASGMEFQRAFARGIIDAGGEAMILGILPTNAVSFTIKKEKADAGIMISASHNPAEENGFKFFNNEGVKFSEKEETALELILESRTFRVVGAGPRERDIEGYRAYKEHLIAGSSDLDGLKVVIDTGNGAASFIAQEVFEKAGAEAHIINNSPDGTNINKECGAMHPPQLQKEVLKQKTDCGMAFDGDADRVVMVDEKGEIVDGDGLILAIAKEMLKQKKLAKNTVVVTEYSNTAFDDELESLGAKTVRVKNGDRYVYEEMAKSGYTLGGEQSGHIILEGNTTGDGVLAALHMTEIMKRTGKPLSELAKFQKKPQVLINVEVKEKKELSTLPLTAAAIAAAEKRLQQLKGRSLIRYSGTQNMLRIMVEGNDKEEIKRLAEEIAAAAKKEIGAK